MPGRLPNRNRRALIVVQDAIASCRNCHTLAPWRQFARDAYGTPHTGYLLVGEAPGYRSWRQKRRFTGPAGRPIRRALQRIADVEYATLEQLFYMTDAVKCHPGALHNPCTNRAPRPSELQACASHLLDEIRALRPSRIVTFGKTAEGAVREAVRQLAAADDASSRKPRIMAFPHPSPRNLLTIRKSYASFEHFERHLSTVFRRLIAELRRSLRRAGTA